MTKAIQSGVRAEWAKIGGPFPSPLPLDAIAAGLATDRETAALVVRAWEAVPALLAERQAIQSPLARQVTERAVLSAATFCVLFLLALLLVGVGFILRWAIAGMLS